MFLFFFFSLPILLICPLLFLFLLVHPFLPFSPWIFLFFSVSASNLLVLFFYSLFPLFLCILFIPSLLTLHFCISVASFDFFWLVLERFLQIQTLLVVFFHLIQNNLLKSSTKKWKWIFFLDFFQLKSWYSFFLFSFFPSLSGLREWGGHTTTSLINNRMTEKQNQTLVVVLSFYSISIFLFLYFVFIYYLLFFASEWMQQTPTSSFGCSTMKPFSFFPRVTFSSLFLFSSGFQRGQYIQKSPKAPI